MAKGKEFGNRRPSRNQTREVKLQAISANAKRPVWIFESVDKSGDFAFDLESDLMNHKDILRAILQTSAMAWNEILSDSHDRSNKSKHHFLKDWKNGCSKEARQRIRDQLDEEDQDLIFSFRINNLVRIIGLKKDERFIVKWFDPEHKFYPV